MVPVKTYGEVARLYVNRSEAKFKSGDDCSKHLGRLSRRHVKPLLREYVGKESNALLVDHNADLQARYDEDPAFERNVLPQLRLLPPTELSRRAGITPRALRDILQGEPRLGPRRGQCSSPQPPPYSGAQPNDGLANQDQ